MAHGLISQPLLQLVDRPQLEGAADDQHRLRGVGGGMLPHVTSVAACIHPEGPGPEFIRLKDLIGLDRLQIAHLGA